MPNIRISQRAYELAKERMKHDDTWSSFLIALIHCHDMYNDPDMPRPKLVESDPLTITGSVPYLKAKKFYTPDHQPITQLTWDPFDHICIATLEDNTTREYPGWKPPGAE